MTDRRPGEHSQVPALLLALSLGILAGSFPDQSLKVAAFLTGADCTVTHGVAQCHTSR